MLRLQAETTSIRIRLASFALHAIEKIAAIKLHARFSREHLQNATRLGLANFRCQGQVAVLVVQHEIVVVAFARRVVQLLHALSDLVKLAEVDWRTGVRRDFARRYERVIDRRIVIGRQLELVVQDRGSPGAGQIEVSVVR